MSTINTQLPSAITGGTSTAASTTGSGFQSLTPSDFVNMMVTQLQNQDPLDPTNSQDLLAQMSQIGQLQASTQLQTTLTGLTLQNQIGAASSLIGKSVQGTDASNNVQSGTVTSVMIAQVPATSSAPASTSVTLNLDSGKTLPLANVTSISPVAATTTGGTASGGAGSAPAVATPSGNVSANTTTLQQALAAGAAQNAAIAESESPTSLATSIVAPPSGSSATLG